MGMMDSIRNRARRSPSLMTRLADPDRQEGAVLRTVFPEDQIEDAINLTARAGAAQSTESAVLRGSMTAPEQTAARAIGGGAESLQDFTLASQGDAIAGARVAQRAIRAFSPGLSEKQRGEVLDIVMSSDPTVVSRALFDDTAAARVQRIVNRVAGSGAAGSRAAAVRQLAGETEGLGLNVVTDFFGVEPEGSQNQDSSPSEQEEE